MKDILECWPFPFEPRQNQIIALNWLQKQKARYLLLESPVGSGKSAIGVTYSIWLAQQYSPLDERTQGNSFILTPQRMLQAQYEDSMADVQEVDMASLYGRSNYTCEKHSVTCDIGNELKPDCDSCPCDIAREYAKCADEAVMNYALALSSFAYTDGFKPRKVMILDECHTLEEHLVNFGTISVTEGRCKKYNIDFKIPDDLEEAYLWTNNVYIPKIGEALAEMRPEYDRIKNKTGKRKSDEKKFLKTYLALSKHWGQTKRTLKLELEYFSQEFVFTSTKYMFEFKRLYGRVPFETILDDKADKFLFMSSTILDKKGFCEDLGFDPDETAFLSLDSEFDIKNRKVMFIPQMKMNAKWSAPENTSRREGMIDTINTICEMNEKHSGLIHTANYQIAKWLVEKLKVPHRIHHHNPGCRKDRNVVINQFMEDGKPSLLISPSSTEGLDLKDDLGRFAIFCKVPFGFLGDEWIRTRMNISDEWYKRRALIDVIQGGGRVVRTEEDWGTVFILDQSWAFLYRTTHKMVPNWWKSAYFDKSR